MAGMKNRLKMAWLHGVEKVGTGASNMASSAQTKLREINMENERRKIVNELPNVAVDLWKEGCEFPTEVSDLLERLCDINEQLETLEAERVARIEAGKAAKEHKVEEVPVAAVEEETPSLMEEVASIEETPSTEEMSEEENTVFEAAEVSQEVQEESDFQFETLGATELEAQEPTTQEMNEETPVEQKTEESSFEPYNG